MKAIEKKKTESILNHLSKCNDLLNSLDKSGFDVRLKLLNGFKIAHDINWLVDVMTMEVKNINK